MLLATTIYGVKDQYFTRNLHVSYCIDIESLTSEHKQDKSGNELKRGALR